jgi:hypothetical protein
VTIPGNLITGNIVITVQPTKKVYTYNVSFSGGQHVTSDGADKATTDKAYTAKLTVTVGYVMPANIEIKVDGKVVEIAKMPVNHITRKLDLYWNYDLKPGKHTFEIRHLNPEPEARVILGYAVTYKKEK